MSSQISDCHHLNPLYTGRLFHCYTLDEYICHFGGVGSILSLLFYICWKILLANAVDPDQMPHHVASDLGLHYLPMTLLRVPGKNGLIHKATVPGYKTITSTLLQCVLFSMYSFASLIRQMPPLTLQDTRRYKNLYYEFSAYVGAHICMT